MPGGPATAVDGTVGAPEQVPTAHVVERRRRRVRPSVVVAGLWLGLVVLASLLAPLLAPYSPDTQNLFAVQASPSASHLLGTDSLGRDLLSRLLYGGRVTLLGVAVGVGVGFALGIPAGLGAGYLRGRFDAATSLAAEILLSIPALVMLITLLAVVPYNYLAAMAAFGLFAAAPLFRIVRNATLGVVSEAYVGAAELAGLSRPMIIRRHIAPALRRTILANLSLAATLALVIEVSLGYLGLDVRPPEASWGAVLQNGASVISISVWTVIPPTIVIVLTALALGVLGDVQTIRGQSLSAGAVASSRHRGRRRAPAASVGAALPPPDVLLEVRDLTARIPGPDGPVTLVDGVSFSIQTAEIVGLVGESGAGKSVTARAVLGLEPPGMQIDGQVWLAGQDLVALSSSRLNQLRGRRMSFVSQEPMVSLDPTFRVGDQLAEAVRRHRRLGHRAARRTVDELLEVVRINDPKSVSRRYPHEISGGMAQRVCIAIALAGEPELLIADEPTTALDVTVQAEILALLQRLREERGLAVLLVTHDWGVIADICDRAVVLYAGQVVELASTGNLFLHAAHPYTVALRAADPHQQPAGARLRSIPGGVPIPGSWPAGCRFAPRCELAVAACAAAPVPLIDVDVEHRTRCIRSELLTPEVPSV
jgi:peptide/nickel transport system permease protein